MYIKINEFFKKYIKENIFELLGIAIYIIILQLTYALVFESNDEWAIGFEPNYMFNKIIVIYFIICALDIFNQRINSVFIRFYNKLFIFVMLIPISVIYIVRGFSAIIYLLFVLEFVIIISLSII